MYSSKTKKKLLYKDEELKQEWFLLGQMETILQFFCLLASQPIQLYVKDASDYGKTALHKALIMDTSPLGECFLSRVQPRACMTLTTAPSFAVLFVMVHEIHIFYT